MKSYPYVAGGTAQIRIPVIMRSSTDGSLLGGLANTAMTVNYQINGSTTGVTVGAGTPGTWGSGHWTAASHSSGGAAKAGHYEFGVPAACFQTDDVVVTIAFSATGAITTVVKFNVGAAASVTVSGFSAGAITSAAFAANAIAAAALTNGLITNSKISSGAFTSAHFASGTFTSTVFASGAITAAAFANNAITSAKVDTTTITAIAAGAWNALTSGMSTAGSIGKRLVDFVTGDIFGRLGDPAGASVSADVAAVKAETAAIKAKTDNLPASPAASGEYTAAIADIPTVAEFEARSLPAADYTVVGDLSGLSTLDAAGVRAALGMASANLDTQISTLATGASIVTLGGYIDTEVASILAIVNSGTHGNAALLTAIGNIEGGTATIDAQDVADALKLAPAAGSPASGSVYQLLSGIQTTVSASSSGSGVRSVTITVTDGTDPLEGATVNLIEGVNSYVATTDASGEAAFTSIQDATFAVRIAKAGYTFAAASLTVDGDETATYAMTAIVITPVADPAVCRCYIVTRDANGAAEASVEIQYRMKTGPGTAGDSYPRAWKTATSDANGLLQVDLPRASVAELRRDKGDAIAVTVPDESTYELPEILGRRV